MADELAGPLAYGALWWWLLVALTAVPVTRWIIRSFIPSLLRWVNRQSRADILRRRSLTVISGIEKRYANGTLTAREANVELSIAVRHFVAAMTGTAVDVMTLAEIEAGQERSSSGSGSDQSLAEAVRVFYSGAFDARPTEDLTVSARVAREVVSTWT